MNILIFKYRKKIFLSTLIINIFFILQLKFLKVGIFRKKIYCENVFWKKIEKNWNENAKIQKYFYFSDSNHARSELGTNK
jgi:predicted RND superfamily exporter protein